MIRMENIVKSYGNGNNKMEALKSISLQIRDGEFVAITGPSGCGKSTLLNIIGGMDGQTDGEYYFEDICISKLSSWELAKFRNKHIGFVFQSFHLARELNAVENVALSLGYAGIGVKERKKRAKELLDRFGLDDKYGLHPSALSGGEMQRVAIARALANTPKILLADEPTGNLDKRNGQMVMNILQELNKEGLTIIMVTHDQELAAMADRNIRMVDGMIIPT